MSKIKAFFDMQDSENSHAPSKTKQNKTKKPLEAIPTKLKRDTKRQFKI